MSLKEIIKNKKELIKRLINENETILDVGFWGQDKSYNEKNWVHSLLINKSKNVFGIDLDFDESKLPGNSNNYKKQSAEYFEYDFKFDVIFAGDLIEHLSNPGLFLESCANNLKNEGRLIMTTPNAFNLFNLAEKLTKTEPTTNRDHVCYYNTRTLRQLLGKNGFEVIDFMYLYSLENENKESYKKKFLNAVYWLLSRFTTKFQETIIVVAKKSPSNI